MGAQKVEWKRVDSMNKQSHRCIRRACMALPRRIAVKVINHLGDEVMKVFKV